ncbi:MAG TPA: glycosyltransferase family 4 protein [Roseiflexaceae bacterium]|nr:glycosyltransferase family 4 protein [Roseiflexaceae bacterium]
MAEVLLTVSGEIAPDTAERIAQGERPRADYFELARTCGADLIDYAEARRTGGMLGRLIERALGRTALLAWACFRRRGAYRAIFTDGEQVGIPLALLLKLAPPGRRPRHLMIAHVLSVKKKLPFFDLLRVQRQIDRILVYATHQRTFALRRWRLPEQQVVWTPFMVDTHFFAPEAARPQPTERPQICAVGLEMRDYPTLLRAADGLPAQVVIAAASPWSKRNDSTGGHTIPANVTVRRFSQYELRQLYADCRLAVMPLYDVDFQAGVTAILEAMAMGRVVICTRTPGQTDVVVDGETGLYVPPGDPAALREAIERLLADPALAERMGQAGRRRVEQLMSLDRYAERLGGLVRETLAEGRSVEAMG